MMPCLLDIAHIRNLATFWIDKCGPLIIYIAKQGCKFSDFCLISENFTSKYLKMVFEISSFLDGFMINSDFQTRSVYHFRCFQ